MYSFIFLFVKQKTAYDMSISDWSSDVCSSDLATFAISFLIRPLCGLFWGPLGDRIGRKSVLAFTILLMAGATFCVGLIPSYDSIGFWAPALLIALRLIQGFSTGGAYGGAATFLAEYAPDARRGLLGRFLEFCTLPGFFVRRVACSVF